MPAPAFGVIRADIAFGGVFYALVDVDQIGLSIVPENARALAEAGIAIKADLKGQIASIKLRIRFETSPIY